MCQTINTDNNSTISEAEPSENEREMFSRINEVLKKAPKLLQDLRDYKGAGEEIREVCVVMCTQPRQYSFSIFQGYITPSQ